MTVPAQPLTAGWQEATAAELVEAAAGVSAGLRALTVGSCAQAPAGLDALSDLDLALVLPVTDETALALLTDPAWLLRVAPVWAYERQPADETGRRVLRVVFTDGRRVDILVQVGADGLPQPRRDLPVPSTARSASVPVWPADAVPALVNRARFDLAVAIAKLGRRDLLIGAHLALEVARQTLVLSMLIRDRETGTTVHHAGTGRDHDADAVASALAQLATGADATGWLGLLERLRAPFDAAAALLWPEHVWDWRAADVLAATARAQLRAAIGSAP